MLQLDDLDDDCLMEVLEQLPAKQLFKMLRINKRMNRLAAIKIRVRIKAIELGQTGNTFFDCWKLHGITRNQVLVFPTSTKFDRNFDNPLRRTLFLNLLTRCGSVKCINFCDSANLADGFLLEIVRRCPDIECLEFESVEQDEWSRVLDLIGEKIIHLKKKKIFIGLSYAELLEMVAEKCPNIKRVDWATNVHINSDLMSAFKALPKSCWVAIRTYNGAGFEVFEDVFDEIEIGDFNLSLLSRRVHRLLSLSCFIFSPRDVPVRGFEFLGLKKLKFIDYYGQNIRSSFNNLVDCRFPSLEEFAFSASAGLNEDDYESLLRRMTTVKKLNIECFSSAVDPLLPGSAIYQLKKLETIHVEVCFVPVDWQPNDFLQQLEHYVDEIKSLKMLTVKVSSWNRKCTKSVIDKVRRMMKKHEGRVELC